MTTESLTCDNDQGGGHDLEVLHCDVCASTHCRSCREALAGGGTCPTCGNALESPRCPMGGCGK